MLKEPISIKILVLGPFGSGKSSLTHRICNDSFASSGLSLQGIDTRMKKLEKNGRSFNLRFWDISSSESVEDSSNLMFRESSIALLVLDINSASDIQKVPECVAKLRNKALLCLSYNLPLVLVLNKKDTCPTAFPEGISDELLGDFVNHGLVQRWLKISCQTGEGVSSLIDILISEAVYDSGDHMFDNTSKVIGSEKLSVKGHKSTDGVRKKKPTGGCCK